uniref:Uncharacterized protein n=1 Tax=Romanomermis culicivorax TaxID=13658 RepID=A0A915IJC0_ROMCU
MTEKSPAEKSTATGKTSKNVSTKRITTAAAAETSKNVSTKKTTITAAETSRNVSMKKATTAAAVETQPKAPTSRVTGYEKTPPSSPDKTQSPSSSVKSPAVAVEEKRTPTLKNGAVATTSIKQKSKKSTKKSKKSTRTRPAFAAVETVVVEEEDQGFDDEEEVKPDEETPDLKVGEIIDDQFKIVTILGLIFSCNVKSEF